MGRPKIFVSSTIYDFADLRSALKHWLQEAGFDVQMSEYADFGRSWDQNSYDACLAAIDACDYYILLVGGRVGGRYPGPERISITRAEYRYAYERFRARRLKMITFVRRQIWNLREDRAGLVEYLTTHWSADRELEADRVKQIGYHPSKHVTDAEAIFGFIDEVGRVAEMRDALDGNSQLPLGNWIALFDNFEELLAALAPVFVPAIGLRRATLEANLRHELVENARFLHHRNGADMFPTHQLAAALRRRVSSSNQDEWLAGTTSIPPSECERYAIWLILCTKPASFLRTHFIDEALRSGEFLAYDRNAAAYRVGSSQTALLRMQETIADIVSARSQFRSADVLRWAAALREGSQRKTGCSIENLELVAPLSLAGAQQEILELSSWLLRTGFGRHAAELPARQPRNAFSREDEKLRAEQPDAAEVERRLFLGQEN